MFMMVASSPFFDRLGPISDCEMRWPQVVCYGGVETGTVEGAGIARVSDLVLPGVVVDIVTPSRRGGYGMTHSLELYATEMRRTKEVLMKGSANPQRYALG
jgi:hypothetical protein